MNIKIDLSIALPENFIAALTALVGNVSSPANPAPVAASAKPTKAEKPATPASVEQPKTEPEPTPAPVNVTDEMIVAAADAAVVKVGSNPQIIKQAVAARFQREDGSPGTLMTTRKDQRPALHAFLVRVGQTGDVSGGA